MKNEINTFDKHMWDGYSGCLPWTDRNGFSQEPIYRVIKVDGENWLFLADSQCVQVEDDDGVQVWSLDVAFPTQESAKAFLRGIKKEFNLPDLGFKPI